MIPHWPSWGSLQIERVLISFVIYVKSSKLFYDEIFNIIGIGYSSSKCEAPSSNIVEGIYQKERTYGRSICISGEGKRGFF